jgi:hypothetical protein
LELNGTHQLLFCVSDVNILSKNINIIKKITEALLDGSKQIGLELNKVSKYIFMSRYQNAEQNRNVRAAKKIIKNVKYLKHLGTMLRVSCPATRHGGV